MATLLNTLVRTATVNGSATYDNNVAGAYSAQYIQQQKFYILTLIKRLLPYLPMWDDAQKVTIPNRSGGFGSNGLIEMRKFNSLPVSTTPISEGVNPDGLNPNQSKISVQLSQYGDWIPFTDILAASSIDDIMGEYMDLLAENAGRKLHKVILETLLGDSNLVTVYGGSATSAITLDNTAVMTSNVIKKAVRTLRADNVPPFSDGYYHATVHPFQAYDLMSDSLWQDVAKYNGGAGAGGGVNLIAGEIGKMHGVKFRESTEVTTDTAGAGASTTYSGLVYGPNAYGIFDLKSQSINSIDAETGKGINITLYRPNEPSPSDPLGLQGFVGWKGVFATSLIDPKRMIRIRTGATQ